MKVVIQKDVYIYSCGLHNSINTIMYCIHNRNMTHVEIFVVPVRVHT